MAGPFTALPGPPWTGYHSESVLRGGRGLRDLCLKGHLLLEGVAS